MAFLAPHFDLPFRFSKGTAVMVEQDTYDDVANCAEAVVRTPQGSRLYDNRPQFGVPQYEFSLIPVDVESLKQIISDQEQRVDVLVEEEMDQLDSNIEHLRVELWPTSDSQ